jgi:hypothetical protein
MRPTRLLLGAALAFVVIATGGFPAPASAQPPTFFLSPGSAATGDTAWQAAVGTFFEQDLEAFPDDAPVDTVAIGPVHVDVGLAGVNSGATAAEINTSAVYAANGGGVGTVFHDALLNRTAGVFRSQLTFSFPLPVRGFGVWVFEGDPTTAQKFRMIVTDANGATWTSNVLDPSPCTAGFKVAGFIGVKSSVGITAAEIEVLDCGTGVPIASPFEVDHLQISVALATNRSQLPGSVLVFPKFATGKVSGLPKSAFEISVVCPQGASCTASTGVRLRGHWVCPGVGTKSICNETNFNLHPVGGTIKVNSTVWFNPANLDPKTITVPKPPVGCTQGYLIVWAINEFGQPIKFDGLIGDAVIRQNATAAAYNAVPIQAVGSHLRVIDTTASDGKIDLNFNDIEYKTLSGTVFGTVRLGPDIDTSLILLTLDVKSNRPNLTTEVDLEFFNKYGTEVTSPVLLPVELICWTEVPLNPTTDGKLLVRSTRAEKVDFDGIFDTAGAVTLIGLVRTIDRTTGEAREYVYSLFHNGLAVSTVFEP